jgi:small subunit ribosomal protein S17
MEGIVVSDKMEKTIIVRRDYLKYVPKFRRYERRRSNMAAHNPPCLEIKAGDKVKLAECRPISKTVSFVVVEKLEEGSSGGKS